MKHHLKSLLVVFASLVLFNTASAQSGSWSKKNYSVSGKWEIVKDKSGHVLKLTGFKTRSAPDLKLFLSPLSVGSINGKNATQGAVRIAKLKSAKGDQTFRLPASVDPGKFKTLLLHCEKFQKPWAGGTL